MYTKNQLLEDLSRLNINPKGTLLVHSSMKSIGEVEGRADTVLDALEEYMKDGLLVFPAHCWMTINYDNPKLYDYRKEPVCVGILPELFRRREGVLRSLHPTHSVACLGKDAAEFILGDHLTMTPCSPKGCWGGLHKRKAQILFIGCSLKRNTFLHYVEELNNIPNRLSSDSKYIDILMPNGSIYKRKSVFHQSTAGDVSQNYDKMEPVFLKEGIIQYGSFGDAKCILEDAAGAADIVSEYLRKNYDLFADDKPIKDI